MMVNGDADGVEGRHVGFCTQDFHYQLIDTFMENLSLKMTLTIKMKIWMNTRMTSVFATL